MRSSIFTCFIAAFLALTFLSGCAVIPFEKTSEYTKDLYRRIQYKLEGDHRVLNIFYATTRAKEDDRLTPGSFNSTLGKGISYGTLDAKIDPSLKIGAITPTQLTKAGLIDVKNMTTLDDAEFLKKLSDAVAASPHNSLMVMVFGYEQNFEDAAINAAFFSYLLDINTPVLLFDWPGDQPPSVPGYAKAQSYAISSGPHLGELLTKIVHQIKPNKLWITAHSMGCQVVCDAFDDMYKNPALADADAEIDHVILAAPDVGQNEFDEKFKNELAAMSKKLTAYVSSDDQALLMSGVINQEERLGRIKDSKEHKQLEELKGLLYVKSLGSDKIAVIDVTPINNSTFRHGYYLESPEFYDDFYLRIFDKGPNVNRRLYLIKFKDNIDYWVLNSGK
ncbi:MAG: alpha/beta hydrolase [Candidatus Omnitrophota bacterium]